MTIALIAGASSIGTAQARCLAARGDDLVMVARATDRLNTLADELRAVDGVTIEVITAKRRRPSRRVHPRDIFSYFFTSRSRFSRDSRWIQNTPSSWSISCWWQTARKPSDSSLCSVPSRSQ